MFITAFKRIPFGSYLGAYKNIPATKLGSFVVKNLIEKSGIVPNEAAIGCVLSAGLGQAFARKILFEADLGFDIPAFSINKVCGSGIGAIFEGIKSMNYDSNIDNFLAGGVENMSLAPFLVNARAGLKMGKQTMEDHMIFDGLQDGLSSSLMGLFAENLAEKYDISRQEQEDYVIKSLCDYNENKEFIAKEIIPFEDVLSQDEPVSRVKVEKFPTLKVAFKKDGTITAATSSAIADGAAFLMISKNKPQSCDLNSKILGISSHSMDPKFFAEAPIFAISKLLEKLSLKVDDIKAFEINEAFAVVPIAAQKALNIPRDRINQFGGACVLGHPLGVSGVRVVIALINTLQKIGGGIGIATVCIGGGEGLAIAIEVS